MWIWLTLEPGDTAIWVRKCYESIYSPFHHSKMSREWFFGVRYPPVAEAVGTLYLCTKYKRFQIFFQNFPRLFVCLFLSNSWE